MLTVVIAPNEDGYGTSGWVIPLAREISRSESVSRVKVVVATDQRENFHSDKYGDMPKVQLIRLPGRTNCIEVPKVRGAVDIRGTLEQCILPYSRSRREYAQALADQRVLDDADLVIDFGVPQLVRAAYGKKVVTVFDHAWSMSLARIIASDPTRTTLPLNAQHALEDIQNDEALTQSVILFKAPICPLDYHGYWRRLLGQTPMTIPGTLGGPQRTLEFANAVAVGDETIMAQQVARQFLGIKDAAPILFVSGGGTPVWDDVLKTLLDEYEAKAPNYHVVIYSPTEAKRRGVTLVKAEVSFNGVTRSIERARWERCKQVLFIDKVAGETHHILFAAFDLVLTRAGGGTVNNCIAFRVPMVLVEEPGMWQVEQIRQSCVALGIAEPVSLEAFIKHSRACVETPGGDLKSPEAQREAMRTIPNHGETWLANTLLAL